MLIQTRGGGGGGGGGDSTSVEFLFSMTPLASAAPPRRRQRRRCSEACRGVGPDGVYYADRVGGANRDLDLLELIDGRSYTVYPVDQTPVYRSLKTVWARVY